MAKEGKRPRVRLWAGAFRTPLGSNRRRVKGSIPSDEIMTGDGGTPAYLGRRRAPTKKSTGVPSAKKRRKGRKPAGLERIEPARKVKAVAPKGRKASDQAGFKDKVARIQRASSRLRQLPSFTLDEAIAITEESRTFTASLLAAEVKRGHLRNVDDERFEWSD